MKRYIMDNICKLERVDMINILQYLSKKNKITESAVGCHINLDNCSKKELENVHDYIKYCLMELKEKWGIGD